MSNDDWEVVRSSELKSLREAADALEVMEKRIEELETASLRNSFPREAPDDPQFILWDIGRMAKAALLNVAAYGLCPAGCGCIWRDNLDGTMSLGVNQRSCKICESKAFDELIPLFPKSLPDYDILLKRAEAAEARCKELAEALREIDEERLHQLVSIWSIRPAPLSESGKAWEQGALQGWRWAVECASAALARLEEEGK